MICGKIKVNAETHIRVNKDSNASYVLKFCNHIEY